MMTPYATSKGIPAPRLGVLVSGLLLVAGGLSIVLGIRPTWGVLLLTGAAWMLLLVPQPWPLGLMW